MSTDFNADELAVIKAWLGSGSINIFGRPFAGKDTQGNILAELFDGVLLGGGEILRNSIIPERSQEALRNGELIPTEDYINIVLPYLSRPQFNGMPLILSSVGRWHGEEPGVIGATESSDHQMKAVIYLNLTEEVAWQRWEKDQQAKSLGDRGNRSDDAKHILPKRFKEFADKTVPVLEYYEANTNLFIEVDADQPGVQVTATILQALLQKATS